MDRIVVASNTSLLLLPVVVVVDDAGCGDAKTRVVACFDEFGTEEAVYDDADDDAVGEKELPTEAMIARINNW